MSDASLPSYAAIINGSPILSPETKTILLESESTISEQEQETIIKTILQLELSVLHANTAFANLMQQHQ